MAQRTKVFVPDENLIWVSAEIVNELDSMTYDVLITDDDYIKTHKSARNKKVNLKSYKLESLLFRMKYLKLEWMI